MLAPPQLSLLSLDEQQLHLAGLLLLLVLLALVASRLTAIHELLVPETRHVSLADVPRMLLRKAMIVAYGAVFLVFSSDKVSSRQLKL